MKYEATTTRSTLIVSLLLIVLIPDGKSSTETVEGKIIDQVGCFGYLHVGRLLQRNYAIFPRRFLAYNTANVVRETSVKTSSK